MARGAALGIVSQPEEVRPTQLTVEGDLPPWLSGSLVRTVPGRFEVGGRRIEHWFDGLALLNAFTFDDGQVSYASKYLQSGTLREADEHGRRTRRGFANDPCLSLFGRAKSIFAPTHETLTDNGNVNIGRLGDQWVALTEAPMPVAFDPATLRTLGLVEHDDALPLGHGTPHPHYDARGAMVNSMLQFGLRPTYHVYTTGTAGSARSNVASLRVREPAYMHSFALTERWIVLVEQPWVIDSLAVARSTRPLRALVDYFSWKPELGTRLRIISRESGQLVRTAVAPAMFLFHTINAYDDGDRVIVDVAAYDDPSIVRAFFLTTMAREDTGFPLSTARRLTADQRTGAVDVRTLSDVDFELPVIDYDHHNGRPYRFAYGVGRHDRDVNSFWNGLVKLDTTTGQTAGWSAPATYPSEPIFVPHPDRKAEGDGVVLSVVLDETDERSFLLVLDAEDFTEIARAAAPQRIPLGFHGQHVPSTTHGGSHA